MAVGVGVGSDFELEAWADMVQCLKGEITYNNVEAAKEIVVK